MNDTKTIVTISEDDEIELLIEEVTNKGPVSNVLAGFSSCSCSVV